MLIKKLKALGAGLTFLLLAGCSTVSLDEPQGLCAPKDANTSPRSGDYACPEPEPARAPAYVPPPREVETSPVQTAPILLPGQEPRAGAAPAARGAGPVRIALLLPMNSSSLGAAATAVRAGFMASVERDGAGVTVDLVATDDSTGGTLASYADAAASHEVVVGPLARPAVSALATGGVSRTTVALNHPEPRGNLPRGMLVAGLSIEDEARQAAEWAAREHPQGRVLILTGNAPWAQRAAAAFEARWNELGHTGQRFNVPSTEGRVDQALIGDLKARLDVDPPELLFAALDVVELRQVRAQTGTAIPCYTGSAGNPGRAAPGMAIGELEGLRVVDLPWLVRPDHRAVMVYPRPLEAEQPLTMSRLYALGIDAFLVARELALRPGGPFVIDGVTGRLEVDPREPRLQRREAMAVYRNGNFEVVDAGP